MADSVTSLTAHVHDLLAAVMTNGLTPRGVDAAAGLHDVVARATALGPDGRWLVASGHSGLGGLAVAQGQVDRGLLHFDAAVANGFNDCVAFHMPLVRPLHRDPRFRALYERMRVTPADLDEFLWLHREMQIMARDAQQATVDNIGRLDTGVTLFPHAPMPTREPNTPGVLITRLDLAATQTALRQAAVKADLQRSAGNVSLSLIDDSWDHTRARHDAWHADDLDTRREQAAAARAFVERPGIGTMLIPCPPLGSIVYPA
ncbi:hypothetical protein ACIQWA_37445 [Kitasatospora sp. NPDC098652]|uniref:hypothetical protein n=1 Tax=Kitasatospora sp. NPDC098652 TaxID=3364095 RepID=UPI003817E87F